MSNPHQFLSTFYELMLSVCVCGLQEKGREEVWGYREGREGQPWPAPVVVTGASVACSSLCSQCAKLAGPDRAPGYPPVCVSLVGGAGSRRCLLWCSCPAYEFSVYPLTHLPRFCTFLFCFNFPRCFQRFAVPAPHHCSPPPLPLPRRLPGGHNGFHFQWRSYPSLPRMCFIGMSRRHGWFLFVCFVRWFQTNAAAQVDF